VGLGELWFLPTRESWNRKRVRYDDEFSSGHIKFEVLMGARWRCSWVDFAELKSCNGSISTLEQCRKLKMIEVLTILLSTLNT
jgi:hypothetical protein